VFDRSVLKNCLDFYNLPAIIPDFYCTYQASRKKLYGLENYKLSTVSDYFGIKLNHHEALSDARAAAKIAIELGLM
jgi:DNA polymerase-3 subunit epsilon